MTNHKEALKLYIEKSKTTKNCYFLTTPYDISKKTGANRVVTLALRIMASKQSGYIIYGATKAAAKTGAKVDNDYVPKTIELLRNNIVPTPNFQFLINNDYGRPIIVITLQPTDGVTYKKK